MLAAYCLLIDHGWPLSKYEALPIREREVTKALVLKNLEARKEAMDKTKKG